MSAELVNGGAVSKGAKLASKILNSLSRFFADICSSAPLNSCQLLYGVQLPGGGRLLLGSRGGGGVLLGRSLPCTSQGVPKLRPELVTDTKGKKK